MQASFPQALITGFERVAAWADLLDEINVFPVADGDTGRNLVVSLSPLRQADRSRTRLTRELLLAASREATLAIDLARRGRNGEGLQTWRKLFGPKFPLS